MIDLLAVYVCPKCGDVLEDHVFCYEDIDTERDEVYSAHHCEKCNSEVRRKEIDGHQCFEQVDHERWLWAIGFYDEELDEFMK